MQTRTPAGMLAGAGKERTPAVLRGPSPGQRAGGPGAHSTREKKMGECMRDELVGQRPGKGPSDRKESLGRDESEMTALVGQMMGVWLPTAWGGRELPVEHSRQLDCPPPSTLEPSGYHGERKPEHRKFNIKGHQLRQGLTGVSPQTLTTKAVERIKITVLYFVSSQPHNEIRSPAERDRERPTKNKLPGTTNPRNP